MFGPRIPAETLERFWTMLAHCQGGLLNASKLAAGIGVSAPTVTSYLAKHHLFRWCGDRLFWGFAPICD